MERSSHLMVSISKGMLEDLKCLFRDNLHFGNACTFSICRFRLIDHNYRELPLPVFSMKSTELLSARI